jgi:peptidoglycan/LPS O-acetylase OafA/YrhL
MSAMHSDEQDWRVDAWRGFAAFMVVYAHFWAFSGHDLPLLRMSFTGVDLFFVLSGFVFAPYFWGKSLSLPAFLVRRFFRVYPAFLLALAVYMALKWQAGQPLLYVGEHLTFTFLQSRAMAFYYNPPFWSLPAEVEFYLLLPLLAWLLRVVWPALHRWTGVLAVLFLALGLRLWVGFMSDRDSENLFFILNHHLPGLLLEFWLGVLAWQLCRMPWAWVWRRWLMGVGLAGWLVLAFWFGEVGDAGIDASWLRGQLSWLAALCFAFLVTGSLAQAPDENAASSLSRLPSFWFDGLRAIGGWAGRLSYGVYLFHMAALQWVSPWREALGNWSLGHQWVALALTLALAGLSLRLCEDPFRRWGRRLALRWDARPAAAREVGVQ